MKTILLLVFLSASTAYAHLIPLKDEALLTVSAGHYDTAFKMEDACTRSGAKGDDCRKLLGFGDSVRSKAARECITDEYVPLVATMKKRINEKKARPHVEILEDPELGKHFYTANDIVFKEAERALDSKKVGAGVQALENPNLGGQVLNTVCSERAALCVTEGSQTLTSPIYKKSNRDIKVGPVVGAVGEIKGRRLQEIAEIKGYRELLEGCISKKKFKQ